MWKTTLALLLALAWAPLFSHCQLEAAVEADFLSCAGDCSCNDAGHCSDAVCCALENSDCRTEETAFDSFDAGFAAFAVEFSDLLLPAPAEPVVLLPATSTQPDLAQAWQFSFRAALPPRAPSFVS